MKIGAERSERLYEEIVDYEKMKSIFQDVIEYKIQKEKKNFHFQKMLRFLFNKVSRRLQPTVQQRSQNGILYGCYGTYHANHPNDSSRARKCSVSGRGRYGQAVTYEIGEPYLWIQVFSDRTLARLQLQLVS